MHIDHKQLVELLAGASGIEPEKVQEQIKELSDEIMQAISDQDAYEIEGFGMFSGIGNRIMFIPSKELETEINFKYVGMEPIELDEEIPAEEGQPDDDYADPFEGLQMEEELPGKRDPYSGLVEGFEAEEEKEESTENESEGDYEDEFEEIVFGVAGIKKEETDESEELQTDVESSEEAEDHTEESAKEEFKRPGADEWGINAHKEDEGAGRLFSSLMGEASSEPSKEEEPEDKDEEFDSFADIFGDDDTGEEDAEPESAENLNAELSKLRKKEAEQKSAEELEAGFIDEDTSDPFAEIEDGAEEDELDTRFELDSGDKEEDDDDFDDPFRDFDEEEDADEEIVPVITNISSDLEQPEPVEEPVKKKKEKKPREKKSDQQLNPVLAGVVILIILAGAVVALGYFRVINIPGITPEIASTQPVVSPPVQQPPRQPETPAEPEQTPPVQQEDISSEPEPVPGEQEPFAEVPVTTASQEGAPSEQPKYGMNGVATDAANDGYTIVIFSLRNQQNAFSQQEKLSSEGYRALITPIQSQQYGTLWRVSLGQFASLYDAAVAAEDLQAPYNQNYFIKKITN